MSEKENYDLEPQGSSGTLVNGKKTRSALSKIRRDLSEEEISSPGALKLLLDKLDQLEISVIELSHFRDKFYESDKEVAVLKITLQKNTASEFLYGFSLSIGAILIGLCPSVWDKQPYGTILLALGISLIVGAVIFKVKNK